MVPRQRIRETVLYFTPEKKDYEMKLKGVLVRMGIRIRIVTPDQIDETIGGLLGFSGWNADEKNPEKKSAEERSAEARNAEEKTTADKESCEACGDDNRQVHKIADEVLVMHNFTSRRMDELFMGLRKAGVPRIPLKAVVTETNCRWSFYHLYEEIREEHEKMSKQ